MERVEARRFVRDTALILAIFAIPAALFADAVAGALSSREPDWLYVLFCVAVILIAVLVRLIAGLRRSGESLSTVSAVEAKPAAGITVREPRDRISLGGVVETAREEVAFLGVSAKRSVAEDSFRRALERREGVPLKLRLLLLDPESKAFEQRAQDEREPADVWRSDLAVTVSRLRAYQETLGLDVEIRYSARYPVWRALIVDRVVVYVSPFLPGKRGTESMQYCLSTSGVDLAYGWLKEFDILWGAAREIRV